MKKETNKKLWAIHNWVGLYAGIIIAILSITGAAAVFIPEIDVLGNRDLLKIKPGKTQVSLTESFQKVKQAYPDYRFTRLNLPNEKDGTWAFFLFKKGENKFDDQSLTVFVNPYTGNVAGSRNHSRSLANFMRQMHVRLYDGYYGRQIVGLGGIALLVSTITGLLIYGNFMKRQMFASIRNGRGIRIAAADWHKLVGISALLFNLVIAITGAWLGLQPYLMRWLDIKPPNAYEEISKPIPPEDDAAYPVDLDALLAKANETFPEMDPSGVNISSDGARMVSIYGNIPGTVYERQANLIVLDKETLAVKHLYDARKGDFPDKLYYVQEALHFGDYGGMALKVLYFIFGLTTGGLSITGFMIYLKRTEKKERKVYA